jgi:hypothetical protein
MKQSNDPGIIRSILPPHNANHVSIKEDQTMKAVATFTTKPYARPYPLQEMIAQKLQLIKTNISIANLARVSFSTIVVAVIALFLISYSMERLNENRIAVSYLSNAYKTVINPSH